MLGTATAARRRARENEEEQRNGKRLKKSPEKT